MSRSAALLLPLLLAACVKPDDEYVCDCIEVATDEMMIAQTGFPNGLVYMQDASAPSDADGLTRLAVQYDATQATPEMVAAAPGALCTTAGLTLVSFSNEAPGPDDMDIDGSRVIRAVCR